MVIVAVGGVVALVLLAAFALWFGFVWFGLVAPDHR
jgi:hypothetical protein